uniref:Uncharacterized protein n=1 Tax=Rhizophora mucronata TaxID=61149 RepID=A0A2P2PPS3_RHIMU
MVCLLGKVNHWRILYPSKEWFCFGKTGNIDLH